jgi:hypothetical protein
MQLWSQSVVSSSFSYFTPIMWSFCRNCLICKHCSTPPQLIIIVFCNIASPIVCSTALFHLIIHIFMQFADATYRTVLLCLLVQPPLVNVGIHLLYALWLHLLLYTVCIHHSEFSFFFFCCCNFLCSWPYSIHPHHHLMPFASTINFSQFYLGLHDSVQMCFMKLFASICRCWTLLIPDLKVKDGESNSWKQHFNYILIISQ